MDRTLLNYLGLPPAFSRAQFPNLLKLFQLDILHDEVKKLSKYCLSTQVSILSYYALETKLASLEDRLGMQARLPKLHPDLSFPLGATPPSSVVRLGRVL